MSKLKKLMNKPKNTRPTTQVMKITDDDHQKQEENHEFQTEPKEDQIDMIHNLQQMEIQASKKDEEPEKKENVDWSTGQIYKEVDINKQVQNEIQNEVKKKENEDKKKENEEKEEKTFSQRIKEKVLNIADTTKGFNTEDHQDDFVALDLSEQEYKKIQEGKKKKEIKKFAIQRQVIQQPAQQLGPRKFVNDSKGPKVNEPLKVTDNAFNKYLEIEQKLQKQKEEEAKGQKGKFNFRDNKKDVTDIQKNMFKSDQEKKIDEVKAQNAIFRKNDIVNQEEQKEKKPRFFNQNRQNQDDEEQKKKQQELENKIKQEYIKENIGKKQVVTEVNNQKVSTATWD